MPRYVQDQSSLVDDDSLSGLLDQLLATANEARRTPGPGLVYVMAVPGIEAVRIGRTCDLPKRMRAHARKNGRIQYILLGECNALDPEGKRAEKEIFRLLGDIRLSKYNPELYMELVRAGHDWYLPDRRRILKAFWSLCRGNTPRFVGVQEDPTFERFTRFYPAYATSDQI